MKGMEWRYEEWSGDMRSEEKGRKEAKERGIHT